MRWISASSSTSIATTLSSASPRSASMRSSACACATVRGKPSRMKPVAQSGASIRSAMSATIRSSGTSSPASMIALAWVPSAVPAFTAARSMSPVESWTMPKRSTSRCACVPLPAPGGPRRIRFNAGSLGASPS